MTVYLLDNTVLFQEKGSGLKHKKIGHRRVDTETGVVSYKKVPILKLGSILVFCTPLLITPKIGSCRKLRSQSLNILECVRRARVEIKKEAFKNSMKMRLKLQEFIKEFEINLKILD